MNVNHKRNCYSCGRFGHIIRNCKNWRIIEKGRRLEYENNINTGNNLNKRENLIVLN